MNLTFWTACVAIIGISLACIGVSLAWVQLERLIKSTGSQTVLKLYELFDDESRRKNRKEIWNNLQNKSSELLVSKEWIVIERTATEMDLVGTMLKHKQISKDLIFERYAEVVIPLWEAIRDHIYYRREQKGGFGWNNFEWMVEKAEQWSWKKRKTPRYSRFKSS